MQVTAKRWSAIQNEENGRGSDVVALKSLGVLDKIK